jgi:hypothetical protein
MRARPAAALPAVLFALALTSALVVGGVHVARTAQARARLASAANDLHAPVEYVLVDLVARWDTAAGAAMPVGAVVIRPPVTVHGVQVAASITRLNEHTYWMTAEATSSASHRITSRLGLLVRAAEGRIRPVSGPAWTRLP